MQKINGETKVLGIIGHPITHSLSPLFQNYFLQLQKSNAVYLPFHVTPLQLKDAINGLLASHVQGLNVTIPHKENILPYVNADKDAAIIGAVNTLKHNGNTWSATNTDWVGFSDVISGLEVDTTTKPVLLFGAGGTSKAILHALNHQKAKEVYLCNRNVERARDLALNLKNTYPNMTIHILPWNSNAVEEKSKACQLIINSTSIGLSDADAFPFKLLGSGHAIDAVYKPQGSTAFCKAAASYKTVDGLPMLIAQGIASLAFWFASEIQSKSFHLPNKNEALQWIEAELGRENLDLSGWRT